LDFRQLFLWIWFKIGFWIHHLSFIIPPPPFPHLPLLLTPNPNPNPKRVQRRHRFQGIERTDSGCDELNFFAPTSEPARPLKRLGRMSQSLPSIPTYDTGEGIPHRFSRRTRDSTLSSKRSFAGLRGSPKVRSPSIRSPVLPHDRCEMICSITLVHLKLL
jgi:hypothetical protein